MFGLTADKLVVIALIAVVIVGPQRLPGYAAQLAKWVKALRAMMDSAKDRLSDEMGPEFDDIDWKKLDPRQYDPRRIIASALLDDDGAAAPRVKISPVRGAEASTETPTEAGAVSQVDLASPGSDEEPAAQPIAVASATAQASVAARAAVSAEEIAAMGNVERWVKGIR